MNLILFILLLRWSMSVQANKHVAPIVTELKDTEHYVIIFKPNVSAVNIDSQIRRIKTHQTNITNHTLASKKISQYSTIGKFKWYHAQFNTASLEKYLSTNNDVEDTIHYWVKDAQFSLQEFIQTSPPSWVKKQILSMSMVNLFFIQGLDRIDQRQGTDGEYRFSKSQVKKEKKRRSFFNFLELMSSKKFRDLELLFI